MVPIVELNVAEREKNAAFFRRVEIRSLFGLFVAAVVYAIFARSLEGWSYYVPRITTVAFVLLAALALLGVLVSEAYKELRPSDGLFVLLMIGLLSALLGALCYSLSVAAIDLYHFILPRSPIVVGLATLGMGCGLFLFRLKARAVYGLTEAVVGVAVAVHRAPPGDITSLSLDSAFFLAILTASVYLVVRGFDNVHQGVSKDPKDAVVSAILHFVRMRLQKMAARNVVHRKKAQRLRRSK